MVPPQQRPSHVGTGVERHLSGMALPVFEGAWSGHQLDTLAGLGAVGTIEPEGTALPAMGAYPANGKSCCLQALGGTDDGRAVLRWSRRKIPKVRRRLGWAKIELVAVNELAKSVDGTISVGFG